MARRHGPAGFLLVFPRLAAVIWGPDEVSSVTCANDLERVERVVDGQGVLDLVDQVIDCVKR